MSVVVRARHLPPAVPVTGHELRSARRAIPASAHHQVIRCVCGAWAWRGKPCQVCADLAAHLEPIPQPVETPVDGAS